MAYMTSTQNPARRATQQVTKGTAAQTSPTSTTSQQKQPGAPAGQQPQAPQQPQLPPAPAPTPDARTLATRQSSPTMSTGAPPPGGAGAGQGVTSYGLFASPQAQQAPPSSPPAAGGISTGGGLRIDQGASPGVGQPLPPQYAPGSGTGGAVPPSSPMRDPTPAGEAAVGGDLVIPGDPGVQNQMQAQSASTGNPIADLAAGVIGGAADYATTDPRDPDGDGRDSDGRVLEDSNSPLAWLGETGGEALGQFVGGFQDAYGPQGDVQSMTDRLDDVLAGMGEFQANPLNDAVTANMQQMMSPEAWEQMARNRLAALGEQSMTSLNEAERRLNARAADSGLGNDGGIRTGIYNDFASRNLQNERDVFNDTLAQQMGAINTAGGFSTSQRGQDQSLYQGELGMRGNAAMQDFIKSVQDNPSAMAVLSDLLGAGGQALGAGGDLMGSLLGAGGSALGGGGLAALLAAGL